MTMSAQTNRGELIRDPADWATDSGWISRRRAKNFAARIEAVASGLEDDEAVAKLRAIAKAIAPVSTPAERRMSRLNAR